MPRTKQNLFRIEDFISGGNSQKLRFRSLENEHEDLYTRSINFHKFYIFYLIAGLVLLTFLARLFSLMVVSGEYYLNLSEGNRIRLVEIEPERGKILDRFGEVLSDSKRVYALEGREGQVDVSANQAKELEEKGLASENFSGELGKIKTTVERNYPLGEMASQVIGYTSVLHEAEVKDNENVSSTQKVGRVGIEEVYDDFLRGKVGKKLVEVDAVGKKVSILGQEEPENGRSISLTIDASLQKIAYDALAKQADISASKRGAVIVSNTQTGEILALASYPSFDPEDIGKSVANLDKPFFNRTISGSYPPGSIFKIVTAIAGLESGKITKDTEIEDVGQFELGGSTFANWFFLKYGKTDGNIKIQRAIARSNDIFFYRAAELTGLTSIRETAKEFGLGQKTGIDLPAEAVGLVPDEVWKESAYGDDWFLGDTMHLGIGQGFILTTPIQINVITSYMASGKLLKPYLAAKIEGTGFSEVNLGSKVLGQNIVGRDNFEVVRAGMKDACKTGGTGAPFFNASYEVGCKTGTAERELGNPHAWFTAFAPFDLPKISVTVLVEEGGEGSVVAAPVAKKIIDWWMANRK